MPRGKILHNLDGKVNLVNKEEVPSFVSPTEKDAPCITSIK